jgi:hypothetical protein
MKWLKSTDAEIDELLKNKDYVGALSKIISKNAKEDYLHPTETSPELRVIMENAFEQVYFHGDDPLQNINISQLKMLFSNLGYPDLYDELVQRVEEYRRERLEDDMRAEMEADAAREEQEREEHEREEEERERYEAERREREEHE